MAKKKASRGGARPGAGAKPIGDEPMIARTIRVGEKQWERWRRAADKAGVSLNQWIRDALDKAAK